MDNLYTNYINATFTSDKDGKMSLEIAYADSDGVDAAAYSESYDFNELLEGIIDGLEEEIATQADDITDLTENDVLRRRIEELENENKQLKENIKAFSKNNEEEKEKTDKELDELYFGHLSRQTYKDLLKKYDKFFRL